MTAGPDLLPSLRAELMNAARRRVGRRRRPERRLVLVVVAVAAVVIAIVAAVQLRTAPPAAAGVDVTVTGGQVMVRLTELEHRPGVIEAAVRKAGLNVEVVAVPAGPSRVGEFMTVAATADLPPELRVIDGQASGSFGGFVLPQGWPGRLLLNVGRPAKGDENYVRFSDAYAKGEPLHCSGVYGLTASQTVARLPKGKVHFDFFAFSSAGEAPARLPAAAVSSSPFAGYRVSDAVAQSAHEVVITITPDGRPVQSPPASPDKGACTP